METLEKQRKPRSCLYFLPLLPILLVIFVNLFYFIFAILFISYHGTLHFFSGDDLFITWCSRYFTSDSARQKKACWIEVLIFKYCYLVVSNTAKHLNMYGYSKPKGNIAYMTIIDYIHSFDAYTHEILYRSVCACQWRRYCFSLTGAGPVKHQRGTPTWRGSLCWRVRVWMYGWMYEWTCMFPGHLGDDCLHSQSQSSVLLKSWNQVQIYVAWWLLLAAWNPG